VLCVKELESLSSFGAVLTQSVQYRPQLLEFGSVGPLLFIFSQFYLHGLHCLLCPGWFSYSLILSSYISVASDLLQQGGLDELEVCGILEGILTSVEQHVRLGCEDEVLKDLAGRRTVVHQPVSILKGFISAECDIMTCIDFSDMRYDSV
jgi:hypothetical protein